MGREFIALEKSQRVPNTGQILMTYLKVLLKFLNLLFEHMLLIFVQALDLLHVLFKGLNGVFLLF